MDAESIKIMAETISIGNLPEEAAREIAEEVTYRVRQLTQDAAKLMHHGKRAKLTCDDIDQALRMTGQEPLYGFQAGEHIPFRFTSGGGRDLHFMEDKELGMTNCVNISIINNWVYFCRFVGISVRTNAQDPCERKYQSSLAGH